MRRLGAPDGRPELLVLRALKLGDLLVAVPALHALRRSLPEHRLVLATPTWLEPLVDLVEGVDALLPVAGLHESIPLPAGRIDSVVNLHGRGPQSHDLLDALAPRHRIGHARPNPGDHTHSVETARPTWDGPAWVDGMHERERWTRLVAAYGMPGDPDEVRLAVPAIPTPWPQAIVIHVGAAYSSREWPIVRFAAVANTLLRAGERVVLTGSAADLPRVEQLAGLLRLPDDVVLAGRTGLAELAALVADARLVISSDTGIAHLASAYGTPSVVIFGPAPPEEWGPPRTGPHLVLTDASRRVGDVFGADPDPALLAVRHHEVLEAANVLLGRGRHPRG